MSVMNLDDMLEGGDYLRHNVEEVHGLIAYFFEHTRDLDLEAHCLELIKEKFPEFSDELKKEIWKFMDEDEYEYGLCEECQEFYHRSDLYDKICRNCQEKYQGGF